MSLAYSRAGSGPSLILLHGLGHRRQGWDAVLGLLTPHRDVIAVDLPGHGESPPLHADGKSAVAVMADEIAGLLDSLALDQPHVAGNSLGGTLALVLAALGRAGTATALSPPGFPNHRYQVSYARSFFEFALASGRMVAPLVPRLSRTAAGRAALFGMVVAKPGRMSPEQARGDMAGIVRTSAAVRAVFRSFEPFPFTVPTSVPVIIGWGDRDRIVPSRNARVARQRIPHAQFLSLPGCGHVPMTDDPELVARILLDGSSG